ncbi:MAG TPA: methylmalonyl Co-A mutase-associated GTPase MeaB, partial [Gemmatimonadaceae bacterium]|nr:methylmalonyl Co-A mutase-associated GTPase MeaB [Gemmatimonadaceae bacterium]
VGQSELDIARTADTSMVVLVPESGDSIQTLKAGLMEIADVFAVNKSDRPGADRLRNELELMIGLRSGATMKHVPAHHGVDLSRGNPARLARKAAQEDGAEHWTPPVLRTVAAQGEGVADVVSALDRHFHYLDRTGELHARRRQRMRNHVVEIVESRVRQRLWQDAGTNAWLDAQLPALEAGTTNPFRVADELLARSGTLLTQVR